MPFKRIKSGKNRGKYRSPRGNVFTASQVRLYYAKGGKFPKRKRRGRTKR